MCKAQRQARVENVVQRPKSSIANTENNDFYFHVELGVHLEGNSMANISINYLPLISLPSLHLCTPLMIYEYVRADSAHRIVLKMSFSLDKYLVYSHYKSLFTLSG